MPLNVRMTSSERDSASERGAQDSPKISPAGHPVAGAGVENNTDLNLGHPPPLSLPNPGADPAPDDPPSRRQALKSWLEKRHRAENGDDSDVMSIVTSGDEQPAPDDPNDPPYRGGAPARSRVNVTGGPDTRHQVAPERRSARRLNAPRNSRQPSAGHDTAPRDDGPVVPEDVSSAPRAPPSATQRQDLDGDDHAYDHASDHRAATHVLPSRPLRAHSPASAPSRSKVARMKPESRAFQERMTAETKLIGARLAESASSRRDSFVSHSPGQSFSTTHASGVRISGRTVMSEGSDVDDRQSRRSCSPAARPSTKRGRLLLRTNADEHRVETNRAPSQSTPRRPARRPLTPPDGTLDHANSRRLTTAPPRHRQSSSPHEDSLSNVHPADRSSTKSRVRGRGDRSDDSGNDSRNFTRRVRPRPDTHVESPPQQRRRTSRAASHGRRNRQSGSFVSPSRPTERERSHKGYTDKRRNRRDTAGSRSPDNRKMAISPKEVRHPHPWPMAPSKARVSSTVPVVPTDFIDDIAMEEDSDGRVVIPVYTSDDGTMAGGDRDDYDYDDPFINDDSENATDSSYYRAPNWAARLPPRGQVYTPRNFRFEYRDRNTGVKLSEKRRRESPPHAEPRTPPRPSHIEDYRATSQNESLHDQRKRSKSKTTRWANDTTPFKISPPNFHPANSKRAGSRTSHPSEATGSREVVEITSGSDSEYESPLTRRHRHETTTSKQQIVTPSKSRSGRRPPRDDTDTDDLSPYERSQRKKAKETGTFRNVLGREISYANRHEPINLHRVAGTAFENVSDEECGLSPWELKQLRRAKRESAASPQNTAMATSEPQPDASQPSNSVSPGVASKPRPSKGSTRNHRSSPPPRFPQSDSGDVQDRGGVEGMRRAPRWPSPLGSPLVVAGTQESSSRVKAKVDVKGKGRAVRSPTPPPHSSSHRETELNVDLTPVELMEIQRAMKASTATSGAVISPSKVGESSAQASAQGSGSGNVRSSSRVKAKVDVKGKGRAVRSPTPPPHPSSHQETELNVDLTPVELMEIQRAMKASTATSGAVISPSKVGESSAQASAQGSGSSNVPTTRTSSASSPLPAILQVGSIVIVRRCFKLPDTCQVSDIALQDPTFAAVYAALPKLIAGVFISWSHLDGPGLPFPSVWLTFTPDVSSHVVVAAVNFVRSRNFRNLSRISPLDVGWRQIGSSDRNHLYCFENPPLPLIAVSCGMVHRSQLLTPSSSGWKNKSITLYLHSQEYQRLVGFVTMASGHPVLHAQVGMDALQFATRSERSKPATGKAATGSTPDKKWFKKTSASAAGTSVLAGDNFSLGADDTVPIYDARNKSTIDFDFVLPRLKESFPLYTDGEIPVNSFVMVGYTTTIYTTRDGNLTVGFNIMWVVLLGTPPA